MTRNNVHLIRINNYQHDFFDTVLSVSDIDQHGIEPHPQTDYTVETSDTD